MRRKHRVILTLLLSTSIFRIRLQPAVVVSNNDVRRIERSKNNNKATPYSDFHPHRPPVCDDECLWKAGADGAWVQDWDFAREHGQYEKWPYPNGPHMAKSDGRFRPSPEAPFLWRTSWRWVDSSPDCQVEIMTKDKLCDVLVKLDVSRVMFYGDSITLGVYHAFMNKLGDVHAETPYTGHFACAVVDGNNNTASGHIIKVHVGRDWGGLPAPGRPRGVYELDLRTRQFVADAYDERIVAIFNIGAHYHNFTHYREDIDKMRTIVSDLYRHQDIYVFRAASPGHDGCQVSTGEQRIDPLKSYDEYTVASPHRHSWDMFEGYNDYTRELLYDDNHANGTIRVGYVPPIHFLDIWNMTALRRDSHHAPSDCLHYVDPGPVDWWNHLLFTYLRRLSDSATAGNKLADDAFAGNCRRARPA